MSATTAKATANTTTTATDAAPATNDTTTSAAAAVPDDHILENIINHPNYKEEAEAVVEEMWQEYSDDTSYFERFESLDDYWNEEDDWYETMAEQYEIGFRGKGAMKTTGAGPKKGKAKHLLDATEDETTTAAVPTTTITTTAPPPPVAPPMPSSIPKPVIPSRHENIPHEFNPRLILQIVDDIDRKYALITKNQEYSRVVPTKIPQKDLMALVAGYDHMFQTLNLPRYMHKYGGGNRTLDLRFGDSVPNYFANVGGESMYQRKAYSIAGLRNLLRSGAGIYSDLAACHFYYPKALAGPLSQMRYETGNVVDLDTVVLRVNSSTTVNMINASNKAKGLPTYSSTCEFGNSEQCKEIAINLATIALTEFQRALKLTDAQLRDRAGHPSQINASKPIPGAYDNSTRGHVPLWRYQNCGQDSFHANCPEIEDVVGALLRAPLHCVYQYAKLFSGVYGPWAVGQPVESASADDNADTSGDANNNNKKQKKGNNNNKGGNSNHSNEFATSVPKAIAEKLDAFFEDCVADSCFNRKWKAIEEFGHSLAHEGTMTHVLQLLQMRHQKELLAFYDALDEMPSDAEDEEEVVADKVAATDAEKQAAAAAEEAKVAPAPSAATTTAAAGATPNKEESADSAPKKKSRTLVVSSMPIPPPREQQVEEAGSASSFPLNSTEIKDPLKRRKEIDFIWDLVGKEGGLRGRDDRTGTDRFITRGDVAAVVRAAAGVV